MSSETTSAAFPFFLVDNRHRSFIRSFIFCSTVAIDNQRSDAGTMSTTPAIPSSLRPSESYPSHIIEIMMMWSIDASGKRSGSNGASQLRAKKEKRKRLCFVGRTFGRFDVVGANATLGALANRHQRQRDSPTSDKGVATSSRSWRHVADAADA